MRSSGAIPALCLAGLFLAPGGVLAQQFVSVSTPGQLLGFQQSFATIPVQCNVTEWGSPLTSPSSFTVQETSAGLLSQISPASFCLRCSGNSTSSRTVSATITVPAFKGTYLASLLVQNANNPNVRGACVWLFNASGPTSVGDQVAFTGNPQYYNPTVFSPVKGGLPLPYPQAFPPIQYAAQFLDYPPASSVASWAWSIDLIHVGGLYKLPVGGSLGTGYVIGAPFSLPDKEWIRDANGNILTTVRVTANKTDGYAVSTALIAGVELPPNKPHLAAGMVCSSKVDLTWSAAAATSYEVHYGPAAGPPYPGTGADEGASPVQAGALQALRLNGLEPGPWAFSVRAFNQHGSSGYADPLLIQEDLELPGQLFNAGNVSLFEALGKIGTPAGGPFDVAPGADLTLRAGRTIILRPGFRAANGSTFRASVPPC